MTLSLDRQGTLTLKLGAAVIRLEYRRPRPDEIIEALVKKLPKGAEAEAAQSILLANLELGLACVTGVGEGDLMIDGAPLVTRPDRPGYRGEWKELLEEFCPLAIIALGQHLSAVPAFMEEPALKKSSGMPGASLPTG